MLSIPSFLSVLSLASFAIGAPSNVVKRAQTVWLAGDSTMAKAGGGSGTEGWGEYLKYSLTLPVKNNAIGGRSARSCTSFSLIRFDKL